jgi:tRNA pseudouridine38-40 synthase
VALVLEYDGAAYKGFQWQANVPTVQDEAEAAIWKFTGEKTRVRGASRTDTGVHAQGQVVDFLTHVSHPLDTFTPALNWYLPADIRVRGAYQVCQEFNSRKDADSRRYRYTLLNSSWPSALLRRSTHWVRANLNIGRMQEAAGYLPGIRDLSAFTVPLPPDRTPVRRVDRWEVWQDGDLVMIEAEASGFLPHQVRMTNGILVEVGLGKMPPEIVEEMLVDATGAQAHRPSLPAKGLCLMSVTYSPLLCDRTAQAPAAAGRAEQNLFETERT